MLQALPMIMGLLEGHKKDEEAKKQNAIAAYMGQAPTAQGGNMGGAITSGLQGMLKGGPAAPKKPMDTSPVMGPNGGKIDTINPYGTDPMAYDKTPLAPDDELL